MSTVIKAGEAGPLLRQLSIVDLADHLAEADAAVQRARRHAAHILSEASRDAGRACQEAKRAGYRAGYARGHEEGTAAGHRAAYEDSVRRFGQEHAHIVALMQRAVDECDAMKEEIRLAAGRDLLEFAVQIASKLTFAIGKLNREAALENLARALRLVGSKTDLTIRVHPDDAEAIRTFAASVLQRIDAAESVNLVEDDSLLRGGCKVSCACTDVDATLETQVGEMVALLLGEKGDDA